MVTTRYFSLGRFAMRDALRYAGVKNGDLVMLPSFVCRDLLASVAEIGAISIFYEVDMSLRPVRLESAQPVKAIVAVNYFGFPQDLKVFRDFAKISGATIIEDNAHGYLSQDTDGNPLGNREKFGITSFRKTLHVDDGAILTTALPDSEIDAQLPFNDASSSNRNKLLRLVSRFESRTKIPTVTVGRYISRLFRLITTGSRLPKSEILSEYRIPGLPNPRRHSVESLRLIDEKSEVARRRRLYFLLQPQVVKAGAKLVFDDLPANTCPYGLPVFASAELKRKLGRIARRNRVTLMTWPDLPNAVIRDAPDFYCQVWLLNFK
jgi:hypothetical protein